MFRLKRIYEKAEKGDGFRILVDKLWPRGVTKEGAKIDMWLKEIAPSDRLRKWFGHDTGKWERFRKSYLSELEKKGVSIGKIKDIEKVKKTVTLVFSASDEMHNNAVVLKQCLETL